MIEVGYVKIYRSLMNKGYYLDSEYVHLWVHLLMCASFSKRETMSQGSLIKLKPGQFVTGRKKLSKDTGIHESKIERMLTLFETEQQIEQQKNSGNRIVTIVSWDEYQTNEHKVEQQMNNARTTGEHYKKNDNKEKNGKGVKISFSKSPLFDRFKFRDAFPEWSKEKLKYYYDAADSYSTEGNKYIDWQKAISNWAAKDEKLGKIKFPEIPASMNHQESRELKAKEFLKGL